MHVPSRLSTRLRPQARWAYATAVVLALTVGATTSAQASTALAQAQSPSGWQESDERRHQQPLPPLDPALFRHAIDGLPDGAVTSAQVRVSGRDGRWSGTAGVAEVRRHTPVPANGRFRIGSATKMFTAVVVLQLAAEHRLDLDESVQHYLPGLLPSSYPSVTVSQLLDHTSGLPSSREDEAAQDPAWFVAHRFEGWTPEEVVASATAQPMEFRPGTKQRYNGVNYFIAGMLIEKVTGRTYAHEVERRILGPLDLHATSVPRADDVRILGPHAHGYLTVDGTLEDVTEQSPYPWAEGGMVSSTADLRRFITALFRGSLLPRAQLATMFTVPQVEYADGHGQCSVGPDAGRACFTMGLQRTTFPNGVTVYGKSGGLPGYTSAAFATRDLRRVLIYSLTPTGNRDGSEGSYVQNLAAAAFDPALSTP